MFFFYIIEPFNDLDLIGFIHKFNACLKLDKV